MQQRRVQGSFEVTGMQNFQNRGLSAPLIQKNRNLSATYSVDCPAAPIYTLTSLCVSDIIKAFM